MLDNTLVQLFLPIIRNGLIQSGLTNVAVNQAYQPTQQGVNTIPTVYYYKLYDKRYGSCRRNDTWDALAQRMVHTETQQYETTFQISALVTQSPENINQVTASDLVNIVARIMQSDSTIQTLEQEGVGILRITDIRNPYFIDDRGRQEASPSFDFILTHKQISIIDNPVVESFDYEIDPI